ncbi:MAG: hypothetical protein RR736_24020 [Pseudomonas sp.]|uniref:hypothetical protein n=1 Tax=Pseudomonas sp. TaxID=306 RepID=UPI002FC819A2
MRILISVLGLVLLAGCVSPSDLKESGPSLEAKTAKAPRDYSRCLTPKWQDLNSNVAATETESGYSIKLNIDMVGTPAMAVVDEAAGGATVRVYVRNGTWNKWVDVARTCL